MPERVYNEVIIPFLSVVENPTQREDLYNLETKMIQNGDMKEEDRHIWPNNKLIMLSSASYKFEYMYKVYEQFEQLIQSGGKCAISGRLIRTKIIIMSLIHISAHTRRRGVTNSVFYMKKK